MNKTVSGRLLGYCGAVFLLMAMLAGWFVTDVGALGVGDAETLGQTASIGSSMSQPPEPILTLNPSEGQLDTPTPFTVRGSGYGISDGSTCRGEYPQAEVFWDETTSLAFAPVLSSKGDGREFEAKVSVPEGEATPGEHLVSARCGNESPSAIFTIRASPTLELIPDYGGPDTLFTVEGDGYSQCNYRCSSRPSSTPSDVEVIWASTGEVIATAVMSYDGTFTAVDVPVPPTAVPGDYEVIGRFGTESAQETFFVLPPATLTLSPDEGPPGAPTPFTVRGSGYYSDNCLEHEFPSAEVLWDETMSLASAPMRLIDKGGRGEFDADVSVPQSEATPGEHLVSARCGNENPSAIFTIPASPVLTLIPDEGAPDALFTVVGDGYSHCNYQCSEGGQLPGVEVIWAGTGEVIATAVMSDEGTFTAVDVPVPPTAVPGEHQVIGRFGTESADAIFVVTTSTSPSSTSPPTSPTLIPQPVLKLYPHEGRAGTKPTPFRIEGSGYGRCYGTCSHASELSQTAVVTVLWGTDNNNDNEVLATTQMRSDGTFTAQATVPSTAAPGVHFVVGIFGAERARESFIVEPPPVDPEILKSTLTPDTGRPGDFFRIEGSGYGRCPDRGNRVVNIYDRNLSDGDGFRLALARNVRVNADGTFSTVVQIPPTAPPGRHEINVQCFGGREYSSGFFTVLDPDAQVPGPPGSAPDPPGNELPEYPQRPEDIGSVKRAYLTTQAPVLTEVFNEPSQLLIALLLAFLLIFIVAFPSELFNNTYEKNHERIEDWFKKWFRWLPKLSPKNQPSWIQLNILGLLAAVLLLMAVVEDPALDYAMLAQVVAYVFAVPLVVFLLELSGEFYSRWKGAGSTRRGPQYKLDGPQWRILPSALIVAGFLAILSKLVSFSPPYVYGLIAVYLGADRLLWSLAENEEKEERGRRVLVGMLFLFVASAVAWLVWSRLYPAFGRELDGFGWLIIDAFLVTFFLVGLETAIFGLMPLAFLKGKELWGWSRVLWAAIFVPVVFLFINVQFAVREDADLKLWDMIEAIILFVIFAIISVGFWGYFHPTSQSIRRRLSRSVRR